MGLSARFMRFLHTADWHIGKTLHGRSLLDEQEQVIEQIIALAHDRTPNVIVIAGDLFDHPSPGADAQKLCYSAIRRLSAVSPVFIIPGNHDAAGRFKALEALVDGGRIHITSRVDEVVERAYRIDGEEGKVSIYGIPYTSPNNVHRLLDCEANHNSVVTTLMEKIRGDAEGSGSRVVVIAHLFIEGGELTGADGDRGSERTIEYGGIHDISADFFDGSDLLLLGHLHRPQTVRDQGPTTHYSGSILRYSFSEASHRKSTSVIEFDLTTGESSIEKVPIELPCGMARLKGKSVDEVLANDAYTEHEGSWVEVRLPLSQRGKNALVRLQQRFRKCVNVIFEGPIVSASGGIAPVNEGASIGDKATAFFESVAGKGSATKSRVEVVTDADERIRSRGSA